MPYVAHLLGVCSLVLENGGDEAEAAAALFHDVAEDHGGAGRRCSRSAADSARRSRRSSRACSDSFEDEGARKAPWLQRKQAYIAHLAGRALRPPASRRCWSAPRTSSTTLRSIRDDALRLEAGPPRRQRLRTLQRGEMGHALVLSRIGRPYAPCRAPSASWLPTSARWRATRGGPARPNPRPCTGDEGLFEPRGLFGTHRSGSRRRDRLAYRGGRRPDVEVIEHAGGVAIIAQPTPETIVLVKQYRHAVGQDLWEIPAGMIEPDESPTRTARRELIEETGYRADGHVSVEHLYDARFLRRTHLLFRRGRPNAGEADPKKTSSSKYKVWSVRRSLGTRRTRRITGREDASRARVYTQALTRLVTGLETAKDAVCGQFCAGRPSL